MDDNVRLPEFFLRQMPRNIQLILENCPDVLGSEFPTGYSTVIQYVYPVVGRHGRAQESTLTTLASADATPPQLFNPQPGDMVQLYGVLVLVTHVEEDHQKASDDGRIITWRTATVRDNCP